MNIEINEFVLAKIKKAKDGEAILAGLHTLIDRSNNNYNRGVLHGYLLMLSTIGVISGDDAISILEQIKRS